MNHNHITQSIFLSSVVAITFLINLLILWPFVLNLFMATVFSVILLPIFEVISSKIKRKGIASGVTLVVFLILIMIPLFVFGSILFQEMKNFYANPSSQNGFIAELESKLEQKIYPIYPEISIDIGQKMRQGADWFLQNITGVFSSLSVIFLHTLLFFMAIFYILAHKETSLKTLESIIPIRKEDTERILSQLNLTITAVVRGSLVLFFVRLVLIGLIFTLLKIPNAIFWSILGSFIAIVPGIGTVFVVVPAIAYLILHSSYISALILSIVGIILIVVIDTIIGPKLIEKGWHVHQFLILLSIIGGVIMIGPFGFFVGPVFLSLAVVLFKEIPEILKSR